MKYRFAGLGSVLLAVALLSGAAAAQTTKKGGTPAAAQKKGGTPAAAPAQQKNDEQYTKLIKEYLQDPRFTTELVDHLPASDTVPTPLKHFGHIIGAPGELDYAKNMASYLESLAKASKRARFWVIGKTEEDRDQVMLAIADEATIAAIDKYKTMTGQLADPRKITEAQAKEIFHTGKPMYYITAGVHSGETGGPEACMELAYRLIVEETPFIQNIRNNVITLITPVAEVDGREKYVDAYYFSKKNPTVAQPRNLLVWWGKYVAHDDNRDGIGQMLKMTQNITKAYLDWHPTIMHDLHESVPYLYTSTGSGPYNPAFDAIQTHEWWLLAETEVMEMAKRKVPGVWTAGFYDGWTPNYLFWIANIRNSTGRFYEVQTYGPDIQTVTLPVTSTSKEWYRPTPPDPSVKWGPRNNTNIQESALLFALDHVAKNRELYLENFYMKSKRSIEKGKNGPTYGWLIPAQQRRKADAAEMVNNLRTQGLEVHRANSGFSAGTTDVAAGDYIIRGDQPYHTMAQMYFDIQNYPAGNPSPYDDTGWTMHYQRDLKLVTLTDASVLQKPMTLISAPVKAAGGIEGGGSTLVVEHTGDINFNAFRFRNPQIRMLAAEEDFDVNGHKLRAGSFIIPNADRASLEGQLRELGLTGYGVSSAPSVKTHALTVPRIGYVHSWANTQNEGWVRGAMDYYRIPYTYFGDIKLKEGNLRSKYDVIVFPHVGGTSASMIEGVTGVAPIPYKKSDLTPHFGIYDSADDIRGGIGLEGMAELAKFVREGGTLITEGSTAILMVESGMGAGTQIERPADLFNKGSIVRGVFTDMNSPIAYGYTAKEMPVYFSQEPVFSLPGAGFGVSASLAGAARVARSFEIYGANMTPNAVPVRILPLEPGTAPAAAAAPAPVVPPGPTVERARVIMQFPNATEQILLSGMLSAGEALRNRALILDAPVGKGHVVLFALRPIWRNQTQGTFTMMFNALTNWDNLSAGKPAPAAPAR